MGSQPSPTQNVSGPSLVRTPISGDPLVSKSYPGVPGRTPRLPESQNPFLFSTGVQDIRMRKAYDLGTKAWNPSTKSGIDPSMTYEEFKTALMEQTDPEAELQWFFDTFESKGGVTGGTTGGATGGSASNPWSNPYSNYYAARGVDPSWVSSFQQQHAGKDPISQYMSGSNPEAPRNEGDALFEANQDRLWGERYQRMYGKPPDEDAWKASFRERQSGYGHTNQATGGGW